MGTTCTKVYETWAYSFGQPVLTDITARTERQSRREGKRKQALGIG
jgi:hypothetical protein